MTRDDIIRMAHEAGDLFVTEFGVASATPEWLERFVALVAAAEREACAKVCEELRPSKSEFDQRDYNGCTDSAVAIRARGNT